ncbi:MAG: 2-hydroxychromene-2-carboxylate isomerase [Achromobacter spanius]
MTAPLPDGPRMQMWFDFASPYSYLAIERVQALAQDAGVRVGLRPFLLGPIFQAQGWNDSPFRLFPGKGAYMMRDIARLADKYGVVYKRPRLFPRMSVLPARIALLGQDEPWCRDFCVAVFRANFQHDEDIQSEDVVHGLLNGLSLDADALIARAKSEAAKEALRRRVDRARDLGLFGAPTFFVGDEMFWGNDRLEDALDWARRGRA